MRSTQKFTLSLLAAAVIAGNAHAAGFQLYAEGSSVLTGNAGAGSAAEGFDASSSTYNPAALVLLKHPEAVLSGVTIVPDIKFSGLVTNTTTLELFGMPVSQSVAGGPVDQYSLAENAFVPAFHLAYPFNEQVVGAISVTAPFGLSTRYEDNSNARYDATNTKVTTIDISPALSFKVNDMVSLGIGIDFERTDVDFDSVIAFPVVDVGVFPPTVGTNDYLVKNNAKDWGIGGHGGVLFSFREGATRIGVNYMSQVKFNLEGTSTTTGLGGPFIDTNANASLKLPNGLTGSFYHEVNKTFALLGSVVWTKWDVLNQVQINDVALPSGPATVITPTNYDNVYRAALGANIRVNDHFLLRFGGAFDQSPINDVDRDLRLPDDDRWIAAVGFHVDATSHLSFDVGYQHIFFKDPTIDLNSTVVASPLPDVTIIQNLNARGTVDDAGADLIGIQAKWQFG